MAILTRWANDDKVASPIPTKVCRPEPVLAAMGLVQAIESRPGDCHRCTRVVRGASGKAYGRCRATGAPDRGFTDAESPQPSGRAGAGHACAAPLARVIRLDVLSDPHFQCGLRLPRRP